MSYGGSPDFSFGALGFQPYVRPPGGIYFSSFASAAQPDGKVIVAGYVSSQSTATAFNPISVTAARYSADGTLDPTFGTGGYFTSPTLTASSGDATGLDVLADAIAIQPDGKIVLAADYLNSAYVVRLDAAGMPDAGFGNAGIVKLGTQATADSKLDFATSLAILPGGKIAVGGKTEPAAGSYSGNPAVARLKADGSVDGAYGTNGLAVAPLPGGTEEGGNNFARGRNIIAQPDGKVVIIGDASTVAAPFTVSIVASRFAADGTLDPTFGTGGRAVIAPTLAVPNATYLSGDALALQPDGKLVIGGAISAGPNPFQFVALRLDAGGAPDPTFGIGGFDSLGYPLDPSSIAVAIAPQPDGKILLANGNSAAVVRLDPDGLPDTGFGTGGVSVIPLATAHNDSLSGVSVLADGKIVVTQGGIQASPGDGIARLLPSGAQSDFDNDGISDPAAYDTATATFLDLPSGGGAAQSIAIGDPGPGVTLPAPGAYDGGGITEVAAYSAGLGGFLIKPFGGGPVAFDRLGTPGFGQSLPAPGDYDHSGRTELAVYEAATGTYLYQRGLGGQLITVPFGVAGFGQSIPAPADYFGTGQADFAVYLVAQGAYLIRNPVSGQDYNIPFGTPRAGQAIPVPGDYDGSGFAELAVYVPATGELIYRPHAGGADVHIAFGVAGIATTLPAPGDYDGSGHDEAAGYLPAVGAFSHHPAAGGADVSVPLGTAGESVAFSLGTDSVAASGLAIDAPGARAESVDIPLTPDVLDAPGGTPPKKKAGQA